MPLLGRGDHVTVADETRCRIVVVGAYPENVERLHALPIVAPSLGGAETLLTRPAVTSHAGMAPAERLKIGITDGLIRMSVGLEACDEILDDLVQALDANKENR